MEGKQDENNEHSMLFASFLAEVIFWTFVCIYIFVMDLSFKDINFVVLILAKIFLETPLYMLIAAILR